MTGFLTRLTDDLAGDLRARGFAVETTTIYRAIAAIGLPPVAAEALSSGIDGVLHFSRRSAEAYVNAARAAGMLADALKPVHFCLSAQVAEPLAQAGTADILISEEELAQRRAALEEAGGFKYPPSQTPWQEIQRGMVDQLADGMVLKPAVKYQRVAQKWCKLPPGCF